MAYFGKTFSFVSETNYDKFVDSMILPDKVKEATKAYKPSYRIDKNADGTFTMAMVVPEKTRTRTFKSGVEFPEQVSNDTTALTTVTVEGDKYTTVQKFDNGDSLTTVIEFTDNDFKLTVRASFWDGGASEATRYYKA